MDLKFGYFTDPTQRVASYDPDVQGDCAFCGKPITEENLRTISIMRDARGSYFYRVHRSCHISSSEPQRLAVDNNFWVLIDFHEKAGTVQLNA